VSNQLLGLFYVSFNYEMNRDLICASFSCSALVSRHKIERLRMTMDGEILSCQEQIESFEILKESHYVIEPIEFIEDLAQ
jgi:hypothetical protein